MRTTIAVLLLALVCGGCATSREARELATETAGAVQTLDVALTRNALASKKMADASVARIQFLLRETADHRADLQARVDASSATSEFKKMRDFVEKQETGRQQTLATADAAVKAAADSRQAWQSPTASLRQVGDNLNTLGREESMAGRLALTQQFVKEVADRVEQQRKAAEKAQTPAGGTAKSGTNPNPAANSGT